MLSRTGKELFELVLAFEEACGDDVSDTRAEYERIISRGDAFEISMLKIKGDDLMQAGIPGGKQVGETLNRLLNAVIDDPELNTKETLLKIARGEQ